MNEQQPRWLFVFNSISTTNLRIYVTLLVFIMTGVANLFKATPIDNNWLIFIAAMSGVDALHFGAKRFTDARRTSGEGGQTYSSEEVPPPEDSVASTDIHELSQSDANKPG